MKFSSLLMLLLLLIIITICTSDNEDLQSINQELKQLREEIDKLHQQIDALKHNSNTDTTSNTNSNTNNNTISNTNSNTNTNTNTKSNTDINTNINTNIKDDDSVEVKVKKTAMAITTSFQLKFNNTFDNTCNAYPFVKKFYRSLDHPSDKYVVFVYHEHGLKNGGFGDRLAGLINAASLALRFNRTLLIRSMNGFDKLFKPKYVNDPNDVVVHNPNEYTYHERNWTQWTKYNPIWQDNDNEELDLYYCINCGGKTNMKCGLDWNTDVDQHSILLRGNRAYICKWATHPDLPAHKQLMDNGFDLSSNGDLFEQAACLLRLAMWPTDYLWDNVREEVRKEIIEAMNGGEPLPTVEDFTNFRIGAHFRCGDYSYINADSYTDACVHDVDGLHPHDESPYMRFGTPWDVGRCANAIIQNYTSEHHHHHHQQHKNTRRHLRVSHDKRSLIENKIHLYIASDSHSASVQINSAANYSKSAISPHGCHVELDQSEGCQSETIVFWLLLALSDVMITQTEVSKPIRYAALYGLQKNPFRDPLNCNVIQSTKEMSREGGNGNWFCND